MFILSRFNEIKVFEARGSVNNFCVLHVWRGLTRLDGGAL